MPSLVDTLALLQRHHRGNRSVGHRATPHSAEWHSLWGRLKAIREAATAGDAECGDWLAVHGPMIASVEACRAHDLRDAMAATPGRRCGHTDMPSLPFYGRLSHGGRRVLAETEHYDLVSPIWLPAMATGISNNFCDRDLRTGRYH